VVAILEPCGLVDALDDDVGEVGFGADGWGIPEALRGSEQGEGAGGKVLMESLADGRGVCAEEGGDILGNVQPVADEEGDDDEVVGRGV
jgi:hypothetical protein